MISWKNVLFASLVALFCASSAEAVNDYLQDLSLHVRSVMDKVKPDVKGKIFIRLDKKGHLLKSHMLIESMGADDKDDLKHFLDACKPFEAPPKAYQSSCCFEITVVSNKHSQASFVKYLLRVPKSLK